MYLCGHPGTGKTSSLNLVLSRLLKNIQTNLLNTMQVFQYNAMTFSDVKSFGIQLVEDLHLKLAVEEMKEKINRSKVDDERLAQ